MLFYARKLRNKHKSAYSDVMIYLIIFILLLAIVLWDRQQKRHSILRNFPLLGHMRYLFEKIRPEIRQYFIEGSNDGRPFTRNQRSLIYQRSKDTEDHKPFGTEKDVYTDHYFYIRHSIAALSDKEVRETFRVTVGGDQCLQKYSASIFNISAMSFGALGKNAIEALNLGAKKGDFYHCTGEGAISPYHLKHGGDLVWQIGTGYFGCRNKNGNFDKDLYRANANRPEVKMIELKLSQGAKPGHGGVLPKAKISKEVADIRIVSQDEDCISPPFHSAFSNPIEFCHFLKELRDLSNGKPIGFKMCVGFEGEFFSICKAMLETKILPDFITVDGAEGGTGAAPIEFSNHVGMPMAEGLIFINNTLKGCGIRDKIKIAVAGKIYSATRMVQYAILGADWFNAARAYMMAIGCIQAQKCNTNRCPVGVATMNTYLQRGLDPASKSDRVLNYHRNSIRALKELLGGCGVSTIKELNIKFLSANDSVYRYLKNYNLGKNDLLEGRAPKQWQELYDRCKASHFTRDA